MSESDRDDQEPERNTDADVEEDALGPSTRMKYAAFLTENAAQAGAAGLHQNQSDQATGEDQFSDTKRIFQ